MMQQRTTSIYYGAEAPELVGTAFFNGFGKHLHTSFTYSQSWLQSTAAFPLAPSVPLSTNSFTSAGLLGVFSDAAPDRWGRHLIFRGAQNSAKDAGSTMRTLDDVDFLLGVDDWARMGALRFSDDDGRTFLGQNTDIPKIVRLPKLLSAARNVDAGTDGWNQVKSLLNAGTSSLGGARPKATVSDDGELWIAKFPSVHDEWNVIAWEAWALDMAAQAGLCVPPHKLQRVGSYDVLLSKRFDREGSTRIAYLSALSLLGLTDGADADYYDLAEALRLCSRQPTKDLHELFARIVLNVALNNTDDHLRNHGLLYKDGGWQLSPLFDVNPNPYQQEERTLDIYGERGIDEAKGLLPLAESMGIARSTARATIKCVVAAFGSWQTRAKRRGCLSQEIDLFAPVFSARLDALNAL